MESKSFGFEIKAVDLELGIFDGYASTFGIVDDGNDIVEPGAFAKTIKEHLPRIKVGFNHQYDQPIGRPLELSEHTRDQLPASLKARFPQMTGGLYTKSQISLTTLGRDVLTLLRDGVLTEMSFAYDAIPDKVRLETVDGKTIRHLHELKLWEYGPVTWGMNVATPILGVKAIVPYQDLPLADEGRAWDGPAAQQRVKAWAGGDEVDYDKYRRAFIWYDSDDPEKLGSYKLGIADIIDGRLTAVPRGVFAVAGVLMGARGGVDIPEADVARCKAHVARYYRKMDRTPPWEREEDALAIDLEMMISRRDGLDKLAAALAALKSAEPSSMRTLTARAHALEIQLQILGG